MKTNLKYRVMCPTFGQCLNFSQEFILNLLLYNLAHVQWTRVRRVVNVVQAKLATVQITIYLILCKNPGAALANLGCRKVCTVLSGFRSGHLLGMKFQPRHKIFMLKEHVLRSNIQNLDCIGVNKDCIFSKSYMVLSSVPYHVFVVMLLFSK